MFEIILAATGHRPNKLGNEYEYVGPYSDYLRREIVDLIKELKPTRCISGMALGVDTLFCQTALDLEIPVIAAIPFAGQEGKWPNKSQRLYRTLLSNKLVTTHIVCEGGYNSAKMQIRNEWMIDNANHLVAVWDGTQGGTMNCVRYAEKKNINIHRINPTGWIKTKKIQNELF